MANVTSWQDPIILVPANSAASGSTSPWAGLPPAQQMMMLTSAQQALAALMTGAQIANVSYGEGSGQKSVTYRRTDEAALRRMIRELQVQLGLAPRHSAIPINF